MRALLLAAVLLLSACAAPRYVVDSTEEAFDRLEPGKDAHLVLMRPMRIGWAIDAPVFELVDGEPRLVGISGAKTKLAVTLKPGRHTFMVIGDTAEFMEVNAAPGKTYYALVQPRVGAVRTGFTLLPLKKRGACSRESSFNAARLDAWLEGTRYVTVRRDAPAWFAEHVAEVKKKQAAAWPSWKRSGRRSCQVAAESDGS